MATIGTMYEDRKSKKSGILVEIDEKHKTMMFEQADGKTFQISTSTFKSGWRKKAEEESEKTIQEEFIDKVSEEKGEPDIVSLVEKKEEKKKKHREQSETTMLSDMILDFVEYADVLNHKVNKEDFSVVVFSSKNGIALKWKNRRIFEVYVKYRNNNYRMFMKNELFESLNNTLEDKIMAMQNVEFIMDRFFNADWDTVKKVSEALIPIILDVVKDTYKESEEE